MTRENLIDSIEQTINKSGLSPLEKTRAIAQVLIDMGMAFEGMQGKLTLDAVKKMEQEYYSSPTLGKALILQGTIMIGWTEQE